MRHWGEERQSGWWTLVAPELQSFLCSLNDRSEVHCLLFHPASALWGEGGDSWFRVRGQRRGRHREAVITAENKDIFWEGDLCFDLMSLLYFWKVFQWVCVPLLLHCRQLVMLCRRSDLSPTDGAELCGCVNTGDSMAWCCLGMRHPLKRPAHHRVTNSKLFCTTTDPGSPAFLSRNSLTVRWWLYFVCTSDFSGNNIIVKPWKVWGPVRFTWRFQRWRHSWESQLCSAGRFLSQF